MNARGKDLRLYFLVVMVIGRITVDANDPLVVALEENFEVQG